jgi:hypothetical protein
LPENERLATVDAIRSTFDVARLTGADLFDQDLDAGFLSARRSGSAKVHRDAASHSERSETRQPR